MRAPPAFGVEAYQVDIKDDGVLQFEPNFFDPRPAGILQRYPIDAAANDYDVRRLPCVPTLQDALETVQKSLPVPEDPLRAAQDLLEERLEKYHFWDDNHCSRIENQIRYELGAVRKGGPPRFCLGDLLASWEGIRGNYDDPHMHEATPLDWKSPLFLEALDGISPLPYAICIISADVDATLADQNLTLHEMRAIMRMIYSRARGPRRNCPIYPFLLISCMGKQHGRITQIVVEEGQIVLQYSKLWSFEVEATAPLDLFICYMLSQLIGAADKTSRLRYSESIALPMYDGLCHASHLDDKETFHRVLHPAGSVIPVSPPVQLALFLSQSGRPFRAIGTELLVGTIYLDHVTAGILARTGPDAT
ncbi:polyketide synthase [Penicillium sp. IBT 18751x]|nr:polyketide synthase [Penicillium sp. IBT 18751x]